MAGKGGRPTKYTPELIEKAKLYLEEWDKPKDKGHVDVIPSQAALAIYLDISISCLENWANDKDKTEFLGVLDKISQTQRCILINRGLLGDFNSNITKLILTKHGYTDKQDLNHAGAMFVVLSSEDEDI